jgi:3-oxoacyl-[acyl-carrier protein] reductase
MSATKEVVREIGAVDRVCIVAGGNCAIGSAIARRVARDHRQVLVGYRRDGKAAVAVVERIAKEGGSAEVVHLDVNDRHEVAAVCEKAYDRHGRLDILINCAAINVEAPALAMEDDDWERVIGTNASAAFRLCRTAAKYMVLGRWGRIVNVSSVSAAHGGRGQVNYAASKAALEAMTRVLALELGRRNITANCIAPGVVDSGMSERIRGEYGGDLLDRIAVRRFGSAEDVAEVAGFLTSDAAGYVSGQVIRVDGGMNL